MDTLGKIRAEIERRHKYESKNYHDQKPDGRPNDGWAESLAIMRELEELLSFLDTLSEEPDKSLEEAAEEYATTHLHNNEFPTADSAFIAGAEWKEEQLMKKAVEGTVYHYSGLVHYVSTDQVQLTERLKQFQDGDKVKVIIVRSDETSVGRKEQG